MALPDVVEVLVTGGSGFLGTDIVESILRSHPRWTVSILDIRPPDPDIRDQINHFFEVDITSAASVNNAVVDYNPDLVIHTAGVIPARRARYSTRRKDWERVKLVNYDGLRNIVDASMAAGCRRFVYTSSCTVAIDDLEHDYYLVDEKVPLGHATLHYGRSKAMAEQYVLSETHAEKGLLACAIRPSTIIGPRDTAVISVMHELIARKQTFSIVGDGNNIYDFMYIENAVQAHLLAAENLLTTATAAGHAFFISNEEPVYFWDFMAAVWAHFGHVPAYRICIPVSMAWFFACLMEFFTWLFDVPMTLDRGVIKDGIRTAYSDNTKARRVLGYKPKVGLAEGLRVSCEGYKKQLATKNVHVTDSN